MNSQLNDDTPENLVVLRNSVKDWMVKSTESILTLSEDDGLFCHDSSLKKSDDHVSLTTSGRCYMALVNACRCIEEKEIVKHLEEKLAIFSDNLKNNNLKFEINIKNNIFKLAHISDFMFAKKFIEKFELNTSIDIDLLSSKLFNPTSSYNSLLK